VAISSEEARLLRFTRNDILIAGFGLKFWYFASCKETPDRMKFMENNNNRRHREEAV